MTTPAIRSLVEAVPLPTLLIAQGVRIVGANFRAETLLGQTMLGRHLTTVIRQPSVLSAIEACQADRSPKMARYISTEDRNEQTFQVHCSYLDLAPAAEGVMVSFEDVTDVEAVGQMRRDFVANVSHELRTPLTALTGFIETLQGPAANDKNAQVRFLDIMLKEAERMNRLVGDLLSLSHVEAEERIRPSQSVDVVTLCDSTLRSLHPVAERSNVTVSQNMPSDEVLVPGDEDQLRQVLTNLTENAIKYGGKDQTVTLHVSKIERDLSMRGPAVRIAVVDTGPGIDPVHVPRLTERFYRIDSHRSREMGGTGLGLAIVKHIVNRHRGRLKIESQLGRGTVFTVILPALD